VIGIDSNWSKLLKTVGLLAVRLELTKLRLKNWKEKSYFWLLCKKDDAGKYHIQLTNTYIIRNLLGLLGHLAYIFHTDRNHYKLLQLLQGYPCNQHIHLPLPLSFGTTVLGQIRHCKPESRTKKALSVYYRRINHIFQQMFKYLPRNTLTEKNEYRLHHPPNLQPYRDICTPW